MYPSVKHGPVANVVPAADFQNVRAQLEDTQESLAAAFARIEVFRMREKLLVAEMAKLRLGDQPNSEGAAAAAADTDGTAAGAVAATTVPGRQQPSSSQPEQQQQQQQQPPLPCYITEVADHLPVMLISSGGRKVWRPAGGLCASLCLHLCGTAKRTLCSSVLAAAHPPLGC